MDTENKKINYVNDIECIEEEQGNFEYTRNRYQEAYFAFYENEH